MSINLHMLPASVNNLAVRVFLRAAGLPFAEENAWGKTRSPDFMAKIPPHLTPAIEHADHPRGAMWESCAIMMYIANTHHLDALYPLLARSTYPRLGFPSYPGEVAAAEDATAEQKVAARTASEAALAEPLEVFRTYFVRDGFIGDGASPSIADIRLAATLEFIALNDSPPPAWATAYLGRVEAALGKAYSEPAADVRSFVATVKKSA